MLTLAKLKPGETFFDLGSGDGRAAIMAAKDFEAQAFGVELREDLVKKAINTVSENGLSSKVKIMNSDMFNVDISSANVIFLYLTTSANEKIKPKLEAELKPGTRVVSHDYEVVGWHPVKKVNFCENKTLGYPTHTIYLYKRG
jgi:tRNA A58 N-methylase Trm61